MTLAELRDNKKQLKMHLRNYHDSTAVTTLLQLAELQVAVDFLAGHQIELLLKACNSQLAQDLNTSEEQYVIYSILIHDLNGFRTGQKHFVPKATQFK